MTSKRIAGIILALVAVGVLYVVLAGGWAAD